MKKELDDALVRDFPNLYRYRRVRVSKSQAPISINGFEVEDGWEPLLRTLSAKLESYAKRSRVAAAQVKEKFGGLRFYLASGRASSDVYAAIEAAEKTALMTCEECGASGKLRDQKGCLRTRCDVCWRAFKAKKR